MMETEENPPKWQQYLDPKHYNVPLHALRYTVTRRLGLYLDQEVEDTNPNGVIGDFGGLAELIGFDALEIQGFERAEQKGKKVLEAWRDNKDLNPTVGNLVNYLLIMGREDILTEQHELIRADVEAFLSRTENFNKESAPIQDQTVSQGPGFDETPEHITVEDVMTGKQTMYDAFVCYNPYGNSQKDLDFVREMIHRLESPPHNLRLFVPHRNDLYGVTENNITAKIISERCRHMIVVLSHNFLESEALEFQTSFAFSLSPGARKRRLVPVRLDNCPTPNIMHAMATCDFTKRELWDWTWNRLACSITIPLTKQDFVFQETRPSARPEGMSETSSFSDADSAIGSLPSNLSAIETSSSTNLSHHHHTAPVQRAEGGTSNISGSQRPFTENFLNYPRDPQKTSNQTTLYSGSPKVARTNSPSTTSGSGPKTSTGRNLLKNFSEKFMKKSKKPAPKSAATTM